MFLLVPAYPGCPGSKAVKQSLLLLLSLYHISYHIASYDDGVCRHCVLNCGRVMTEHMWWMSATALRRAFDVTLYPLRQLMTPFHDSSENFYGDVGQVKVAVRQDSTPADCVRLQQLARQVIIIVIIIDISDLNSENYCKDHGSGGEIMTRNK